MSSEEKKVVLVYVMRRELSEKQVWPDGGAPENWSAEDVLKIIQEDVISPDDLMREWNLYGELSVQVGDDVVRWR